MISDRNNLIHSRIIFHMKEPFCPPKPSMPDCEVIPSTFYLDLQRLHQVWLGFYPNPSQRIDQIPPTLRIAPWRTSSSSVARWASQLTDSSFPQSPPSSTDCSARSTASTCRHGAAVRPALTALPSARPTRTRRVWSSLRTPLLVTGWWSGTTVPGDN